MTRYPERAPFSSCAFKHENGELVILPDHLAQLVSKKPEGEHSAVGGGLWGHLDTEGREVVPVTHKREELPGTGARAGRCRSGGG